jgi:hypothetical protein
MAAMAAMPGTSITKDTKTDVINYFDLKNPDRPGGG